MAPIGPPAAAPTARPVNTPIFSCFEAFVLGAFTVTVSPSCAWTGRATTQLEIRVNPNAPARSLFVNVFMSCILALACLKTGTRRSVYEAISARGRGLDVAQTRQAGDDSWQIVAAATRAISDTSAGPGWPASRRCG